MSHSTESLKSSEAVAIPVFFYENRFFFWLQDVHELFDLRDGTFFWLILIHIWQIFKYRLDIIDFLVEDVVNLFLDGWAVASE